LGSAGSADPFLTVLLTYIVLTALNHLLIYAQEYPGRVVAVGTALSAKRIAMRKLSTIDYGAYTRLDTGTTLQVAENGADAGSTMINGFWLFLVITALTLPVQLYLIQRYDTVLFLVVLAGYAVLFVVAQFLMRLSKATMSRVISKKEDISRRFARAFMEVANFRVMRRLTRECDEVDKVSAEVVGSEGRIRLVNELFFTGFALLVSAVEIIVIVRQAVMIRAGISTVGTLAALVLFVRIVFGPISAFSFAYVRFRMSTVPWRRYLDFLGLPDDPNVASTGQRLKPRSGDIELRNVCYSAGDREVLRNVSLSVRGGAMTALVGSSGAGKTTLVRHLLGLVRPQSGTVNLDGISLSEIDLDAYYASIAFVSQDAPVLDGTIRENLLPAPGTPDRALHQALQAACIDQFVAGLDGGLDTAVGERGVRLSAGERQRIALARTLISTAPYVFLDEPTSALDADTEQRVIGSVLKELKGRTVVLVAHRLQTVRMSDVIYVLEGGTVVESGPFERIVQGGGRFQELWSEQTKG
jgi:ABC-type multidrug transport system fused ATPase/permease subunit